MDLHDRIAEALGWTREAAQSFSLRALRDLVRPVSMKLADEITATLNTRAHIATSRRTPTQRCQDDLIADARRNVDWKR